jgi:transposase
MNENEINLLPWPSRSPDLNPIENIWAYITKKIRSVDFRPANAEELQEAIENAWERLAEDYNMRNLILSMRRRLQFVIEANGAAIHY